MYEPPKRGSRSNHLLRWRSTHRGVGEVFGCRSADALESNLNKMGILVDARVKGFIKSIPTVIPADKEESE